MINSSTLIGYFKEKYFLGNKILIFFVKLCKLVETLIYGIEKDNKYVGPLAIFD